MESKGSPITKLLAVGPRDYARSLSYFFAPPRLVFLAEFISYFMPLFSSNSSIAVGSNHVP